MPLNLPTLKSQLQAAFADPPATYELCAQAWASAMQAYAAAIIPASTTVAAAGGALAGALSTAFQAPDAVPGMESAFAAFAASLGAGMAAAGYAAVPPPAPVGFTAQFAGPKPGTHTAAASAIGDLIHAWMLTGTATLVAPPFTLVIWS